MLGERGERSCTRTCYCVSMNSTRLAGLGLLFVLLLFVVGMVKPVGGVLHDYFIGHFGDFDHLRFDSHSEYGSSQEKDHGLLSH